MFQIDDPSASAGRPARPPAGNPGWFTGGDPATGTLGTRVRNYWLNTIQAELLAILAAAGVAPDAADDAQVMRALRSLAAPRMVVFYESTSWTVPADVRGIKATVIGAGGAGGGTSATNGSQVSAAAGGNSGTVAFGAFPVAPGETISITIGIGGRSLGGIGYPGGTSSFGARLSSPGGQGVDYVAPANAPPLTQSAKPPSAVAVGGNVGLFERQGAPSVAQNLANFLSGRGADSIWGSGAPPVATQTAHGAQGLGFGAGGGGAATGPNGAAQDGGYGTNGLVVVEW